MIMEVDDRVTNYLNYISYLILTSQERRAKLEKKLELEMKESELKEVNYEK